MLKKIFIFLPAIFIFYLQSYAASIFESGDLLFSLNTYFRADLVSFKNVFDLDSHKRDDHSTYLGIDYSFGFNLDLKDKNQQYFIKLERNGPYDYDAPLFIHNTLMPAASSPIKRYRNEELLPQVEEFWADLPLWDTLIRFRPGLLAYDMGKGFTQGTGSFENYGFSLYHPADNFSWRFYYFRPDLVYKNRLGPKINQEKEEGIDYGPNCANYFALDAKFTSDKFKFQPFLGLLLDNTTSGKRTNLFAAPVHREALGVSGIDFDAQLKGLSLGFELARNFGRAESASPDFKDIEHKGYLLYTNASYDFGKLKPHSQFLFSSGNKVTTEMVDNGDTKFLSGSNKAFSIYSPLNTNFFDSLSPIADSLPMVFFGWGNGLSYGFGPQRPSTLADDGILENLIMPSAGFDFRFSKKFSAALDWWYIFANQKGVGTLNGEAKELSRNLGQEIDLSLYYDISKNINVSLCTGYFLPGRYFREERDDTGGSLFTPFVRGDGNANSAYQIELSLEMEF